MSLDLTSCEPTRLQGMPLTGLPESVRMEHGSARRQVFKLIPSLPVRHVCSGMTDGEVSLFLANKARHVRAAVEASSGQKGWIARLIALKTEPYVRLPGSMLSCFLAHFDDADTQGIENKCKCELRFGLAEQFSALFREAFETGKRIGGDGR